MRRIKKSNSLTKKVMQTLVAVGFAMSPLATAFAADGTIQKVNGTQYLTPGDKKAEIIADAVLKNGDNSVALNTFNKFTVDAGKIANMHFKDSNGTTANNLVNIVGEQVNINGIVNAVKDNKIGGNLYFLSNKGIAVGPTGVVNAGSVTMMTPTNQFYVEAGLASWADQTAENGVNSAVKLVGGDGNIDVSALEKGFLVANWGNIRDLNIPLNKTGTITIEGKINTVDGINLLAGKNITIKPTASLVSKASLDFASLVNTTDADGAVEAGLSGDLVATKTGSGDIKLAVAANTVNTADDNFADFAKNAEGYNTVETSLTVEKGAVIDAVGDASLTTVSSVGSGQAGFFGTDLKSASADDLVGTMAKTVSKIDIDGSVSGNKVAITADASNIYVNGSLSNFTNYAGTMVKSFIPLDSDVNYVVMDNQASVNIGADAVITARSTIKDSVTEENGVSLGGIELIPATENRDYALNIKANAYLQAGAGSSAAATKLSSKKTAKAGSDVGQLLPNAGVTYLEANNQANVTVAGKVDSAGDTNMNATASMYAEASAAADAPTRTTNEEVNNFVNLAAVIADLRNTAAVDISGGDKTIGGNLNVEANSDGQSFSTSATVGAGETSLANTALNITDVATDAAITVDGNLTADSLDIHADNSVGNSFTANNKVGLSKRGAKMASRKGGMLGGLLGAAKGNGSSKGSKKSGLKAPEGLEKLGEFFSAGASIALIDETNAANVTVKKTAKLTSTNDLNVTANTILSGSYINVSGATSNYNTQVNTNALISASTLISNMDNSANVIIEGGDTTNKAKLSGANVNIKGNSQFIYGRPAAIWGDFQQICSDVQTAYQGDSKVIDDVTKLLGVSQDQGFSYMEDRSTEAAIEFFQNVQNLIDDINASTIQANLDAVTSLTSIPSALMAFIDGSNYANVNVFASTGGKSLPGTGSSSSAKLAVAGTVNLSTLNNNAKVIVGKNTQLTATKTLDVNATATQSDVTFNGKVKLIIPKTSTVGGADTAVGGNVGIYETNVNSLVVVGEGAELTGRAVDLSANNDVLHIVATFGGGTGGTTGVTGMASYMSGTSDSIVAVDDEAILTAKAATVNSADFAVDDTATTDEKAAAKAAQDKAVAENGSININATNKTNIQNIVFDKTAAGKSAVGASVGIVKYDINNIAGITDTDQDAVRTSTEVSNLATILAAQLNPAGRAVTYNLDNYKDYQRLNTNIDYLNTLTQSDIDSVQDAYEKATDETTKAGLLAQKEQMDYQLANKTVLVKRLQTVQAEMKSQDKANADKYIAETESDLAALDKEYTDKTDAEYIAEKAYLDGKKTYFENLKNDTSVIAEIPETPASGPDLTVNLGTTGTNANANRTTGTVTAGDVSINATTSGLVDNITVAGVTAGKSQKKGSSTSSFGLPLDIAASGSASVNMMTGNSAALLEGANVDLVTTDATADTKKVAVTASDDSIIGAYSGAAAVKKGGGTGGSSGFSTTLAGAVAYNKTTNGVVAQIKDTSIDDATAVDNTATKKGALVAAGLALGKQSGGSSSSGIVGDASASYNDNTSTIHAVLDNAKINKDANTSGASTALNNIAYDKDIQIAGGVTAQYAKANVGVGVAASYLDVNNDVKALMTGSSLNQMSTVKNYAATNLIQVGTAISVGIVSGQNSNGVQGAAAINNLTNNVNAELDNTTINATQLEVRAFDGKLSESETDNTHKADLLGTNGEGYDVSGLDAMSDVNASKGTSDVSVNDSALGQSDGTTADEAYKTTTFTADDNKGNIIITGAVGTALNNGSEGYVTGGAAVVYNNINNNFTSSITTGSSVTATGADGILVKSNSDTLLIGTAAGAAVSKGQNGLAASGSASVQKLNAVTTATVEDSTLTADKTNVEAESTSRLINVAGQVSATKGNVAVGLTTADNILNNTTGAYVKGSNLIANTTATGSKITVKAINDSKNYAIAAGAAASSNNTGAVLQGSMAMNSGANNTEAVVEKNEKKYVEATGAGKSKIANAAVVDVTSTDNTVMKAIAGGVSATQSNAAIGGAVAYNTITGQYNKAALNDTDVTTVKNATVNVKATDNSNLLTIAAGAALKSGQTGGAAEGSVAIADTTKSTMAVMDNSSIKKDATVDGVIADVEANSTNTIITSADVLAGTTGNVAFGAAVAVNKSHNDTLAEITGGNYNVQDLKLAATSSAKIIDVGIGVAATTGEGGSLAGNIAVNNIGNNTKAILQKRVTQDANGKDVVSKANVIATGNVDVLANSAEHLRNYTGALSATVGSGYVAGGFSVAVNNINGDTTALVDGATVEAQGLGDGIKLASYGTDSDRNLTTTTNTLHGLVVNADADHKLDNVVITGATALSSEAGVAGGGTVSVNSLGGSTIAEINESDVNASGAAANGDVNVLANDNTEVDSHLSLVAVGAGAEGGGAVGAAADTNILKRSTKALIFGNATSKNTVNANLLKVKAFDRQDVLTNAIGLAGSGGMYGSGTIAGTISVSKNTATTIAEISDINSTNNGFDVSADHKNKLQLFGNSAALSGAMGSGSIGLGIGVANDDSDTEANVINSTITHNEDGKAVDSVKAANDTYLLTEVADGAIAISIGGAASGSITVNNMDNLVKTTVQNSAIGTSDKKAASFTADANNSIKTRFATASGAAALGAIAVGVGVTTVDTSVVTTLDNSQVYANNINLTANENRDITQYGAAAGVSGVGLATNVMVTSIGTKVDPVIDYSDYKDKGDKDLINLDLTKYIGDSGYVNSAADKQSNLVDSKKTGGAVGNSGTDAGAINALGSLYTEEDSSKTTDTGTMWKDIGDDSGKASVNSGLSAESTQSGAKGSLGGSTTAQGVKVEVKNGSTLTGTEAVLNANADTNADIEVYQGNFTVVGVSVSAGVLDVKRNSGITLDNATITANNITIGSSQGGTTKQDVYQGAIGGVNVNVAYGGAYTSGANEINITNNSKLVGQGNIAVSTADTTDTKVNVYGITAGAVNGGALVADAGNTSTNAINVSDSAITNGITYLNMDADGKVTDAAGKVYTTYELDAAGKPYIATAQITSINATKNNSVTADAKSGTVGAASIYGVVSVANDDSSVKVNLAKAGTSGFTAGNNTFTGTTLNVTAENNPQVKAVADSISGTLVGGIGVSVASAKAQGSAEMLSKGNIYWVDEANLGAEVGTQSGNNTAEADVFGVTASGVTAVQANAATATAAMTVSTDVSGDSYKTVEEKELYDTTLNYDGKEVNSYKVTKKGKTNLKVNADNGTKLKANAEGITAGGLIASGTNLAFTENTTTSTLNISGTNALLKGLTVNGSGAGDSTAIAKGYGGGLVSVSPVAAKSKNNSTANIAINVSGDFTAAGDILIQGLQSDKSNILADALTATVAGYSGTESNNTTDGSTIVNFNGANLTADGTLQVAAVNTITIGDTEPYALKGSGYGGAVSAGATLDNTVNKTATINVDNASALASAGEQYLEAGSSGDVNFKGTVKARGAATEGSIDTKNTITVNNNVNLANKSSLKTTAANSSLTVSASDNMNLNVTGVADIKAGVGSSTTQVTSTYTRNNKLNLTDGTLSSKDNLNLYAGKDATGAASLMEFVGESEAYNRSGAPLDTTQHMDNSIVQNNWINIGSGVKADSVADINLFADSGVEKIRETAIAYDWLSGSGSSDYTSSNMGQKSRSVAATNYIKNDGTLIAGAQNQQNIIIGGDGAQVVIIEPNTLAAAKKVATQQDFVGKDGLIIKLTDSQGNTLSNLNASDFTVGSFDYGKELYDRYLALQELISGYSENKESAAYLGYKAELQRVVDKMQSMGLYDAENGVVIGKINVDYISLPTLVASGGNINVNTNNLSGNGSLEAKGSPEINVINNTNLYLKVNDITVGDAGGKVVYNDNALSTEGTTKTLGEQIAAANSDHSITISNVKVEKGEYGKVNIEGNYGGTPISAIDTDNKVYTMTPLADIEINGHIDSMKGIVSITSKDDNIIIQGKTAYSSAGIDAGTISLSAENGSVSQGYHDGITNIGGSVQYQYGDLYDAAKTEFNNQYGYTNTNNITDVKVKNDAVSPTGGNNIAGDNIYISASDININGTLQSGYATYEAYINGGDYYTYKNNDADTVSVIQTVNQRIAQLKNTWEQGGSKILSDATVTTGKAYEVVVGHRDSSDSTLYYLSVYYNPSTGKLIVPSVDANGGKIYLTGRISSTGSGSIKALDGAYNIKVVNNLSNDLQLGKLIVNDINGLISITDVNAKKVTEIRRDGTTYKSLDGTVTGTAASLTSYQPEAGLRYNWTTGQDSITTKTFENTVEKGLWGDGKVKKDFTDLTDLELEQFEHATSPTTTPEATVDKPNGEYIGAISGLSTDQNNSDFLVIYTNTLTHDSTTRPKEIANWKTGLFGCHHWAIYQWKRTTGTSQSYVGSVKADKAVDISFFGVTSDKSSVDVTSKGNIAITDNIGNKALYQITDGSGTSNTIYGGLNLTSTAGSIEQFGGTVYGANASLSAKGAIDLNNITTGNLLTVSAKSGVTKTGFGASLMALPSSASSGASQDINLNVHSAYGAKGDVSVGNTGTTSTGVVTITADGNLIQANDTDVITGQRINLASTNGTIGQTGKALKVYAGQTPTATDSLTASLNATAYGDINLEQTTGDMRIGTINSSNGDVTLTTSGSIVDALPYADKIDRGDTASLIQKWKDLNLISDYGAEGNAGWTINGLLYAIQDNIINPTSGVDTSSKAPNIIGKNITLNVGDSAGLNDSAVTTIDLTTLNATDHLNELKTLAGADASTVTWDAKAQKAYINEKLALGIESKGGNLTVTSTGTNGNVYLQGRVDSTDAASADHKDMNIAGINTTGNVLVESLGNIANTHTGTTADITGKDVYLMAAGALGTAEQAMTTAAKGAVLATAVDDIYLNQISTDPLQIKSMSSGKNIFVNAVGDITSYIDPNATAGEAIGYIRTENDGTLQLVSQTGSVGTADAAVRIFNSNISDEDDRTKNGVTLSAEKGGVNVTGVSTEIAAKATPQGGLYLSTVTAKDGINVTDNGTVKVLGAVNNTGSGSVNLTAQKDLTVGAQGSIDNKGTGLSLTAGQINATDPTKNVTGNIALRGDVSNANGTTVLASKTGAVSQTYDNDNATATNAQLTAADLTASAVNGIDLGNKANVLAKVSLTNTNNDVVLGNGGSTDLDITLNHAVTGSINLHNYVSGAVNDMTVNGVVQATKTIDAVNDEGKLTFTTNDVWASAESVELHAIGDVVNNRIIQVTGEGKNIDMLSDTGNVINNKNVSADGGYIHMDAAKGVQNYGTVTAAKDVELVANDGNITNTAAIDAGEDLTMTTKNGSIENTASLTSQNGGVSLAATNGTITNNSSVTAKEAADFTATGDISLLGATNTIQGSAINAAVTKAGNINVEATLKATSGDISLTTPNGNIKTDNAVTAAQNVTATTGNGNIEVQKPMTAQNGSIDLETKNGAVNVADKLTAAQNVTATTGNGDVNIAGAVEGTNGNVNISTKAGNIVANSTVTAGQDANLTAQNNLTVNQPVKAGQNANLTTEQGNLEVAGSVTAQQGNANLQAGGDGTLYTQGGVLAGNNVNATTNNGSLNIDGAVTAQQGNANLQAGGDGTLHTQGNILAGNNINANTNNGSLTVDGTITAQQGSINLQTNNETDPNQGAINLNGAVLTVTPTDAGNINIITNNGNVNYTGDITVTGTGVLKIQVGKGNITAGHTDGTETGGKLQSLNGSVDVFTQQGDVDLYEVFAEHKASVGSQSGDVKIAKINGDIVLLQTKDMDNKLHVGETVAGSQVIVSSNRIGLDDIQQRPGKDNLLLMTVDSADPNEPIDQLGMNFSKVNKGIEFSQLWLNNGNIDVKEGKFFIDKLVVNNKAVFTNKGMTTSVFGAPPVHDNSTSIYWDNASATNPKKNLAGWHDPNYNGEWMYLFFGKDGRQQISNGALLHLTDYNYVFDQRYTGEDYLSFLLDSQAQDTYRKRLNPNIPYYNRNNLYDISDSFLAGLKQAPQAEIQII